MCEELYSLSCKPSPGCEGLMIEKQVMKEKGVICRFFFLADNYLPAISDQFYKHLLHCLFFIVQILLLCIFIVQKYLFFLLLGSKSSRTVGIYPLCIAGQVSVFLRCVSGF